MTASESVKVIVRCRPMNQRERDLKCKAVLFMDSGTCSCSIINPEDQQTPPKVFTFDGVYYLDSTTEQIYNEIAYPLVEGVLEGYNGTVFAYGQTGCGKSFSMQGVVSPPTQRGIIPRSFEHIFEAIATAEDTKFLVHASYLEIYNEEIRDLLGKDVKKKLELKEHPEKGIYIPGLSWHAVHNVKECEQIMDKGWKNRSTGSTLMNADSSRSHSIFTISLEMMATSADGEEHIRKGKLNLVDLAGSERQAKTGATGDRLKEATKINLSLSALGNVISALVDGKIKHVPYRDSKLTRLLQDSLGGNTKTLMVACLSPADNNYDETLSTLRYANRAKDIKNKPKINEDPKDAMLREYQEEIKRLKAAIGGTAAIVIPGEHHNESDTEKERLKKEYEEMMAELKTKYQEEQRSNARLQEDLMFMRKQYENEVAKLNSTDETAGNLTVPNANDPNNLSTPVNMDDALKSDPTKLSEMQVTALARLQQLEEQMVGGEKVHDTKLKEKRLKKKRAAEKRLKQLKEALHAVNEDDRSMLKVYDNIQEELKAKTDLLRKERKKVEAAQREIRDLQGEFEADRMDYLETIRRQDQQVKLLQQILDKVQPCIRRECNYSNLDRVKAESIWDEDLQKWRIPDLVIVKTRLPPAGVHPGGRAIPHLGVNGHTPSPSQLFTRMDDDNPEEDKFLQKLARGEKEDIAGNYFKPKRTSQLLKKVQEDATGRNLFLHKAASAGSALNMVGLAVPSSRDPLAGLNLNSSVNGTFFSNNINPTYTSHSVGPGNTSSSSSGSSSMSPEVAAKKPIRLAAISSTNNYYKKNRKKPKANYNTMDML